MQIVKGERGMPVCVNILLGDAFRGFSEHSHLQKGYSRVSVHYSSEADNDDTLAAYAQV